MTTIFHDADVAGTTPGDPDLSDDARDLYAALTEVLRVAQFRDRDRACCYDVSVTQCYGLKTVVDVGPLTVNDLAGALYLDKSTASRLAAGLEDKGYIQRSRDPDDGRIVVLEATDAGRALSARIEADLAAEYAELLRDVGPDVRRGMVELLGRLGRSLARRVEASGGSCCVVRE